MTLELFKIIVKVEGRITLHILTRMNLVCLGTLQHLTTRLITNVKEYTSIITSPL